MLASFLTRLATAVLVLWFGVAIVRTCTATFTNLVHGAPPAADLPHPVK